MICTKQFRSNPLTNFQFPSVFDLLLCDSRMIFFFWVHHLKHIQNMCLCLSSGSGVHTMYRKKTYSVSLLSVLVMRRKNTGTLATQRSCFSFRRITGNTNLNYNFCLSVSFLQETARRTWLHNYGLRQISLLFPRSRTEKDPTLPP